MLFQGIIPPVATPFTKDGTFDRQAMGTFIDHLIESKVDALFFLGTGGEFSQMSTEMRKDVAQFAIQYVAGRVPVLIGTGSVSTNEVVDLTKHAEHCGADGVVVINPYYWSLGTEQLEVHYAMVVQSTSLPIILYNFPALTGQDLSPKIVANLIRQFPQIVGIKETVDEAGHIREMIRETQKINPHFAVFAGFDDHVANTLLNGGAGGITGGVNIAPHYFVELFKAWREENYERIVEIQHRILPLMEMYRLDQPFVSVIKEALQQLGHPVQREVLRPALPLNEEKRRQVTTILQQAKLK
ncbi:MAG TPA: dihydrodipicolinate synthase family protein [Savagea sp.]